MSAGSNGDQVNVYGIAAIAGLVGMFSKQAADKLGEIFNNLFRTKPGEGDDMRSDKILQPPIPGSAPTHIPSGSTDHGPAIDDGVSIPRNITAE